MIKDVLTIFTDPFTFWIRANKGIGENQAMVRNENDPEYVDKGPPRGEHSKN